MLLYVYLKRKDHTSFTGPESFIWAMIEKQDYSWIPSRGSFAIQSYVARTELEQDRVKEAPIDGKMFERVATDVHDIKKELHGVASKFEKAAAAAAVGGTGPL